MIDTGNLLRCCRFLGYLSLCLFLCSTFAGCEGGSQNGAATSTGKTEALMAGLSIFVLAVFVGFEVITKVPPTLHTPLMSGSNAISGITLVGALLVASKGNDTIKRYRRYVNLECLKRL